jgi:hypothetical protein
MPINREEILEYASRYVTEQEVRPFPMDGELFCLLERQLPTDRVLAEDEGWRFGGYGICLGYDLDHEEKPLGKWIWFNFVSLAGFPPAIQTLKLQPPHIARGSFQNQDRTAETRILALPLTTSDAGTPAQKDCESVGQSTGAKLLQFPLKGSSA